MAVLSDVIQRGTLAARPAAGIAGRLYYDTTNSILYRDSGSAWESVEAGASAPAAHASTHQSGGSDAFTGIVPGSAFAPSGLTGAVAASRYVGATASGAPTAGTFAVGDYVLDQTGKIWVCTTAGTPGTWTQIGSGGGGDSTLTAAYASRPAASNDGNLFLPSDGYAIDRDTGTAYVPWGPLLPLTRPPAAANWTVITAGTATLSDDAGALVLNSALDATQRGWRKATPTVPYTITIGIIPTFYPGATVGFVVGWRQSLDGKCVLYRAYYTNGHYEFHLAKNTDIVTFSANYIAWLADSPRLAGPMIWLRFADDNTNRIVSVSNDGKNFNQIHSVLRTDFMTADQVVLGIFGTAAARSILTVLSYKEA